MAALEACSFLFYLKHNSTSLHFPTSSLFFFFLQFQARAEEHTEKSAADNKDDDSEARQGPNNIETSAPDPHPVAEVMHPSSPVSTPEVTPRQQATEEEGETTQQGETNNGETAEQEEFSNREEENVGEDYT